MKKIFTITIFSLLCISLNSPAFAAITLTETHVNTTCSYSNGSIDLSVSGASGSITYNWNNGATTQDLSNIPSGIYSVVVVDGAFQNATLNVSVGNTPGPALAYTITDDICNFATGNVQLSIIGGTAPVTVVWSTGATTEDLDFVVAGTYSVTVTDNNGCTADTSATVDNGTLITLTESHTNSTGSNNGSVNITVTGGTAPYTYAWSNSATTEDLSNLGAGTYTVTVNDASGCSNVASVIITVSSAIQTLSLSENVLTVFPNPVSDMLMVSGKEMSTVSVFNLFGKLIFITRLPAAASVIYLPANELVAGVYLIAVTSSKGEITVEKFVKE